LKIAKTHRFSRLATCQETTHVYVLWHVYFDQWHFRRFGGRQW